MKEETRAQKDTVPYLLGLHNHKVGPEARPPQLHMCEGSHYGTFIFKDGFPSPALELSSYKYMHQISTAVLIITVEIWRQSRWPT